MDRWTHLKRPACSPSAVVLEFGTQLLWLAFPGKTCLTLGGRWGGRTGGWKDGWMLASQPCPIASQLTARGRRWLAGDMMAALKDGSPGLDDNLLHRFFRIHPSRPSPGGRRRRFRFIRQNLADILPRGRPCPVCCLDPNGIFYSESHFNSICSVFVLTGASFQWK